MNLYGADSNVVSSGIFGFTVTYLLCKMRKEDIINIEDIYHEIDKIYIQKLKK